VLAEVALRQQIPRLIRERGDDYFARGRVRLLRDEGQGAFHAHVEGGRSYEVDLAVHKDELTVSCDCRYYLDEGEACKHIWAAIRAASAKQMLPEKPLTLILPDFEELEDGEVLDWENAPRTPAARPPLRLVPQPRPWERFLEAVGRAPAPRAPRPVPDEIAYVVKRTSAPGLVALHILGRAKKKSGEWGKWKQIALETGDLRAVDPFDRETLALLANRYGTRIEPTLALSGPTIAWWLERLSRAGKLFIDDEAGDLHPLSWDENPPWKLRVAIVSDQVRASYRVEAAIERDGDTMPIANVDRFFEGLLIHENLVARFDAGGNAQWLRALRGTGAVEIPHADTESFRAALLHAPIGTVALPAELGWQVEQVHPRAHLSLRQNAFTSELTAELFFQYGEWRVPHRSIEMQKSIGRTLIRRETALENEFRDRLGTLPVIAGYDGWRIRQPHLEEVVGKLAAEGWSIELDSAPVRIADDLDVEITSGIDWFDLNASAAFGELRVELPELLTAALTKQSLLRLSDGSFGIMPAGWDDALAPVVELGRRHEDSLRFHSAQALIVDALLHNKPPAADGAYAELRDKLTGTTPEPRQEPATLTAELRPYQRAGLGWMHFLRDLNLGGCLADDMGLGKTVQALALLETLRAAKNGRPSLVVAPRSLLFNWAAEARKFAPQLRLLEHHGTDRMKNYNRFDGYDLVLTTYATMRLDVAELAKTEFEYVILDEAQAIKNAGSQVAKASRLLKGRHRLALSGTPIENQLADLWSLFEFLNPGLLGSSRSFSHTFANKNAAPERREALARALRPLILRRTKEQVAPELPERIEQTLYCELEGKQKRDYEELREHYRQSLLGRIESKGMARARMHILEALLRLRQAACHPALIAPTLETSSAKLDLLLEELTEVLASGHRALVFSQFTTFLGIVRNALDQKKIDYLYLDGKTQDRQSIVERFQSATGPPLFLISLKAGGLGLNLTNADYIFLLDPWWNPAVEAQAIDRAHRIGRQRPVIAYRLIARDTVEEKILELQSRKRDLADSIISEDNSVLRGLAVEDLELLLS
jgi:superfamily II DNA or RNA helicase